MVPREGDQIQGTWSQSISVLLFATRRKEESYYKGPWDFGGDLLVVVEDFDSMKKLEDLEFNYISV